MQYVGKVRLILIKVAQFHKENDYGFYTLELVHKSCFADGFECHNDYASRNWINEELEMMEWNIEQEMKDKPHGFYEFVADLYYEGHTDYFGEYDSEQEFRSVAIQKISYKQAYIYDDSGLLKDKEYKWTWKFRDYWKNSVSPYMAAEEIYRSFAHIIDKTIGQNHIPFNERGMTIQEVKDFYTMSLLSTKMDNEEGFQSLTRLEDVLNKVLEEREKIFTEVW